MGDGCVGVEGLVFVCSDGCGWWVMGVLVWRDGCVGVEGWVCWCGGMGVRM